MSMRCNSVELEPGRWYVIQLHLDKTGAPGASIVQVWCDSVGGGD